MSSDLQSTRDDLAFLRSLVQVDDNGQRAFGEGYFAAGLIYGGQMLLHGAQALGLLPTSGAAGLAIGLGPTVVFVIALVWLIRRNRTAGTGGSVGRAVTAVFQAVGLANLALIAVIGSVAWREHSFTIWLIYPCAVFVFQGAAWLVAFAMRRQGWLALVALGWFATAIGMAWFITTLSMFVIIAGAGIWLCMALPGWVMLRQSRKDA